MRNFVYHSTASVIVLLFIVPLWWVIVGSLREPGLPPPLSIEWWPPLAHWPNYIEIFRLIDLAQFVGNSLFTATVGALLTVLMASWAGFALAQLPDGIRHRLVLLAVLMLLVPVTALWLTRFIIFTQLGLINTRWVLIAPTLMGTSTLFVLLFYWTFRRMPGEMIESARLDGAGALRIWRQIGLPLARPTVVAVAILSFVHYWSDFIDPLLYLKSQRLYTLAVGLRILQQMDITNWSLLMAGSVVMTMPVIIGYLLLQFYSRGVGRLAGIYGR